MTKTKILIVEDELSIRQLYEMKLRGEGYDVMTAVDGVDGLEKAESMKPDLILLDLRMPEMDGEEMLTKLREEDWGEHLRVIILTNISRSEAPLSLANLGIEQYIVKVMFTPAQVLQVVKRTLES